MSKPLPSRVPYFLSFQEWAYIQNIKKNRKITEIDDRLVIQNNKENYIFNAIIKKLICINIFDLSRISYLVILFLSPYIDPYLKAILNYEDKYNYNYELPLDKTICNILNLVLNQLITIELFLNVNVFILYLNLHNHYKITNLDKTNSRITYNNLLLFKISQLVETITNKIPSYALSLLIMKTINKFGQLLTWFEYHD